MANTSPIGLYLIGRNVTFMAATAMYVNADGTLSYGSDYEDLHAQGRYRSFKLSLDFGLQNIHPTDARISNYVETVDDFDLTVSELQSAGGYAKIMQIAAYQSSFFGFEKATAYSPTGEYFVTSVVAKFAGLEEGVEEGENVIMAHFKPCGIYPYFEMVKGGNAGPGAQTAAAAGLAAGNMRARIVTNVHP